MVSLIFPIYQVELYVKKSLESILDQSYQDFEIIVVDDGCTDRSVEIVKEVLNKTDVRWKLISQPNLGQAKARNVGIENSSGEFVAFLDSDDLLDERYLELMVQALKVSDAKIAFCDFKFVSSQDRDTNSYENKVEIYYCQSELISKFMTRKLEIISPGMMFKRSFIMNNQVFYDESSRYSEDQLFIWRCICNADGMIKVNIPIYFYYKRSNSIMTSTPYEKVILGYQCISNELNSLTLSCNLDANRIIARWRLGALYSCSKYMKYDDFKRLAKEVNMKKTFFDLFSFPEIRAFALSKLTVSSRLFYLVCRII